MATTTIFDGTMLETWSLSGNLSGISDWTKAVNGVTFWQQVASSMCFMPEEE